MFYKQLSKYEQIHCEKGMKSCNKFNSAAQIRLHLLLFYFFRSLQVSHVIFLLTDSVE